MSVKSNQLSKTSYELDILKVAAVLGIDQERLLSYVYSKTDQNQQFNDKKLLHSFKFE
jgi:hypothetical protein